MSNIVIIRHSSPHHSGFSGYAQLLKYINMPVVTGYNSWIPYRIRKFITERIDKSAGLYDSVSLQKETELIWRMITQSNGLAHFLNGERDIHYSTYFKKFRQWQQVATFHKPPSILKSVVRNVRYVRSLDGAIAVGANQALMVRGAAGVAASGAS